MNNRPTVEASKNGIIISGPSLGEVHQEMDYLMSRVSPHYLRFTEPVKDAAGHYCAIGHVQLSEPGDMRS